VRLTQRDTAEVKDFSEFFKIDYGITDLSHYRPAKKLRAFVEQRLSREELLIAAVKSHWTTIIGIPRVRIILGAALGCRSPVLMLRHRMELKLTV